MGGVGHLNAQKFGGMALGTRDIPQEFGVLGVRRKSSDWGPANAIGIQDGWMGQRGGLGDKRNVPSRMDD